MSWWSDYAHIFEYDSPEYKMFDSGKNYDIEVIIKKVMDHFNLPLYKEEYMLAKAILHLRRILPASYKSTAIVKILLGQSKKFTTDEFFGFGKTNPAWRKTKVPCQGHADVVFITIFAYYIISPLSGINDPDGTDDSKYIDLSDQKPEELKILMIERQLDKLIENTESNPNL